LSGPENATGFSGWTEVLERVPKVLEKKIVSARSAGHSAREYTSAGGGIHYPPMKKLLSVAAAKSRIPTPVSMIGCALMAVTFWSIFTTAGIAQDPQCTVCHKRSTTLTFSCADSEYARHLDHGDTMGACGVTPPNNQ